MRELQNYQEKSALGYSKPQNLINKNSYRNFPDNLKINFGDFSEKDEFLINLLQKGLTTKIVKGNEKSQIHILKNNELGKEEYQLKNPRKFNFYKCIKL